MGGRAVEGSGLENRQGFTPLVGSNPTPSAITARTALADAIVCAGVGREDGRMASPEAEATAALRRAQRLAETPDLSWASALVVDDVEENRDLLVRRLKRLGVGEIEQAVDGRQALNRLAERDFDLVLLDIMMPEVNGYEVLDALSLQGRIHDLPVLVISALSEIDAVARCLEQG